MSDDRRPVGLRADLYQLVGAEPFSPSRVRVISTANMNESTNGCQWREAILTRLDQKKPYYTREVGMDPGTFQRMNVVHQVVAEWQNDYGRRHAYLTWGALGIWNMLKERGFGVWPCLRLNRQGLPRSRNSIEGWVFIQPDGLDYDCIDGLPLFVMSCLTRPVARHLNELEDLVTFIVQKVLEGIADEQEMKAFAQLEPAEIARTMNDRIWAILKTVVL